MLIFGTYVDVGIFIICALAVAAASYLLGCLNGSIIISRLILRDDIRKHGSGNAGITNFYRTFGAKGAVGVIAFDMLKMFAAVLIGVLASDLLLGNTVIGKYWAGSFCMLGHMFPCMFEFRGGKGILSGGALTITLDWRVAVAVWGAFLVFFLLSRRVSMGSLMGTVAFPIATQLVYHNLLYTIIVIIMCILVVWRHRGNFVRLIRGQEPAFTFRKKKENIGGDRK